MSCDVCALPAGGFAHVVGERAAVAAYHGAARTAPVWRQPIATDFLRFLRCASAPDGSIAAVGQAGDGRAWLVSPGSVESLAPTAGVDPVALRHDGRSWIAYVVERPDCCREIRLDGATRELPVPAGARGIRSVTADGTVVFNEVNASLAAIDATFSAQRFDEHIPLDGIVVGHSADRIGVLIESDRRFFTLRAGQVHFGVRVVRVGPRIALCALTDAGAWFAEIAPPYPPHEAAPAAPAPVALRVPPAVTINHYAPLNGTAPLTVAAVGGVTAGVVETLTWRWRRHGDASWQSAPPVPSTLREHRFLFEGPGRYEISLRGDGPGGVAETGLRREVTVKPRPGDPVAAVSYPIPGPVSLKAHHGFYLCSDLGTPDVRLVADRPGAGAWETFDVEAAGGPRVHLRAGNGSYVTAEEGGGRELVANRSSAPRAWEQFELVPAGNDGVALKTTHGLFVTVDGASGAVRATASSAGAAETFTPSRPLFRVIRPGTIAGQLRVDQRFFVNAAGTFRPVFTSALSLLARPDDQLREFLDWTSHAGFNGIRVFAGALTWAGQTAPQARERLPQLLAEAGRRGLYVEVTAITDSREGAYDPGEHFRAISQLCQTAQNAILEVANEPYHGTQADAVHAPANLLAIGCHATIPFALGAAEDDESTMMSGGSYVTAHLDRGRDKWNQVRRVRELAALSESTGKPVLNNEPIGAADVSQPGRREADPAFFFCMGALNRLFEVGGVFHSEAGLQGVLPGPGQQACAEAFVAGSRVIPTDDRLVFRNAGWADSPVVRARFDDTVVRAYTGLAGAGAWTVLVGLRGDPGLELRDPWRIGRRLAERPGVAVLQLER